MIEEGDVEVCEECGKVLVIDSCVDPRFAELVCPSCERCSRCDTVLDKAEVLSGKGECMSCFSDSQGD